MAGHHQPAQTDLCDAHMRYIFAGLLHDLLDAIDQFGYEAVYVGVGCKAFPAAGPLDEEPPCPGPAPAP